MNIIRFLFFSLFSLCFSSHCISASIILTSGEMNSGPQNLALSPGSTGSFDNTYDFHADSVIDSSGTIANSLITTTTQVVDIMSTGFDISATANAASYFDSSFT